MEVLISLSAMEARAGGRDQKWFDGLTKKAQREYLAARPKSKFHPKNKKAGKVAKPVTKGKTVAKKPAAKTAAAAAPKPFKMAAKDRKVIKGHVKNSLDARKRSAALRQEATDAESKKAHRTKGAFRKAVDSHPKSKEANKAWKEALEHDNKAMKAAHEAHPVSLYGKSQKARSEHAGRITGFLERMYSKLTGKGK